MLNLAAARVAHRRRRWRKSRNYRKQIDGGKNSGIVTRRALM